MGRAREVLMGQKHDRLEVIKEIEGSDKVLCKCDCGNVVLITRGEFKHNKSCGCLRRETAVKNIRYGREVLARKAHIGKVDSAVPDKDKINLAECKFRGVEFDSDTGKYNVSLTIHGKTKDFGQYDTYDAAVNKRKYEEEKLLLPLVEERKRMIC